jgi:hypothetical protein
MSELMKSSAGDDFEWVNAWASTAKPVIASGAKSASAPRHEGAPLPQPMADAGVRISVRDIVTAKPAPAEQRSAELAAADGPSPDSDSTTERKVASDPDALVHPATRRFFAALRAPAPVEQEAAPSVATPPLETIDSPPAESTFQPPLAPSVVIEPAPPVSGPSPAPDILSPAVAEAPEPPQRIPATRRFFAALRPPAPVERDVISAAVTVAPVEMIDDHPPESTLAPAEVEPIEAVAAVDQPAAVVAASEPAAIESEEASLVPQVDLLEFDIAEIERARDALMAPAPFTIIDPRKVRGGRFSALRNPDSVPILVGSVVGVTLLIVFGAAASLISLR